MVVQDRLIGLVRKKSPGPGGLLPSTQQVLAKDVSHT